MAVQWRGPLLVVLTVLLLFLTMFIFKATTRRVLLDVIVPDEDVAALDNDNDLGGTSEVVHAVGDSDSSRAEVMLPTRRPVPARYDLVDAAVKARNLTRWIVVTSINHPTDAMRLLCNLTGWQVLVGVPGPW